MLITVHKQQKSEGSLASRSYGLGTGPGL